MVRLVFVYGIPPSHNVKKKSVEIFNNQLIHWNHFKSEDVEQVLNDDNAQDIRQTDINQF